MEVKIPWHKEKMDPDDWLKQVISVVFDQDGGSPFWLDHVNRIGLDAKNEIQSIEDLDKLGKPDELTTVITHALQKKPVEHYIPRSILKHAKGSLITSVTGGTTVGEKTVVYENNTWESAGLHAYYCLTLHRWPTPADEANVLYIGPTGNHILGKSIMKMAQAATNGLFFTIDLDVRIIKKMIAENKFEFAERYKQHIFEQVGDIVSAESVDVLITTSKLLADLVEYFDVSSLGLKAIMHGGTAVTPDEYRLIIEEMYPETLIVGTYGNALFGSAFEIPRPPGSYDLNYFSNYPRIMIEVVNPEHLDQKVDYGQMGRVLFRRLTPEIFIPAYLERDQAIRIAPEPRFGFFFDGVRNPAIFEQLRAMTIEGVY